MWNVCSKTFRGLWSLREGVNGKSSVTSLPCGWYHCEHLPLSYIFKFSYFHSVKNLIILSWKMRKPITHGHRAHLAHSQDYLGFSVSWSGLSRVKPLEVCCKDPRASHGEGWDTGGTRTRGWRAIRNLFSHLCSFCVSASFSSALLWKTRPLLLQALREERWPLRYCPFLPLWILEKAHPLTQGVSDIIRKGRSPGLLLDGCPLSKAMVRPVDNLESELSLQTSS